MSNWLEIGKLEDIPRLGSRVVGMGDQEIAIFRTDSNEIFAVDHGADTKSTLVIRLRKTTYGKVYIRVA